MEIVRNGTKINTPNTPMTTKYGISLANHRNTVNQKFLGGDINETRRKINEKIRVVVDEAVEVEVKDEAVEIEVKDEAVDKGK